MLTHQPGIDMRTFILSILTLITVNQATAASSWMFTFGLPPLASAAAPDTTSPVCDTITIQPDGTNVVFAYSEPVVYGSDGNDDWSFAPSGGAASLTYSSGSGSATITYISSRIITSNETAEASYTQPGDGWQDGAGNNQDTDVGPRDVVNVSTQAEPPEPCTGGDAEGPSSTDGAAVGLVLLSSFQSECTASITNGMFNSYEAAWSFVKIAVYLDSSPTNIPDINDTFVASAILTGGGAGLKNIPFTNGTVTAGNRYWVVFAHGDTDTFATYYQNISGSTNQYYSMGSTGTTIRDTNPSEITGGGSVTWTNTSRRYAAEVNMDGVIQ